MIRRQRTDDRGQTTEDRRQRIEVGSQRSEVRGQKSEVRRQMTEVGSQRTGDSMQPFDPFDRLRAGKLRTGGQLAACRKQSQLQNLL